MNILKNFYAILETSYSVNSVQPLSNMTNTSTLNNLVKLDSIRDKCHPHQLNKQQTGNLFCQQINKILP